MMGSRNSDDMRILLVSSFFPPWRGGAETYVYNLSKHLRKRGQKIRVICGDIPVGAGFQLLDGVEVERLKIMARVFGTPIIPELPYRLAFEDADIIHTNFPTPYNAFISAAFSRLRN